MHLKLVSAILANPDAWRLQGGDRVGEAAVELRRTATPV
jgi:hypothetical protein